MGYLGNHLATVATAAFAAVLTALWPYFEDLAPQLGFIFLMAVPIAWFMALTCWLAQKSADYAHGGEKKSSAAPAPQPVPGIAGIRRDLAAELEEVREAARLKDGEIERLNREISNLQTLVQIESLKAELANLKVLASRRP